MPLEAALGPPGLHTTARELQTRTFDGAGASNTTKIPRQDPKEREERKKIVVGEGQNTRIFGRSGVGWSSARGSTPHTHSHIHTHSHTHKLSHTHTHSHTHTFTHTHTHTITHTRTPSHEHNHTNTFTHSHSVNTNTSNDMLSRCKSVQQMAAGKK